MPERIRRPRPHKKVALPPRAPQKPVEIMREFEQDEAERTSLAHVVQSGDVAPDVQASSALSPRQMIHLQRTIGNHATKQLIQRTQIPAIVAESPHVRTSAELDAAAPAGAVRLVQRTPINSSVAADTNLRSPKSGSSMAADDRLVPVRRDATITVDSATRMTKIGANGATAAGFEKWYKVLTVSGVDVADDNMWIHVSTVKPVTPTPAPIEPPPTPTPVSAPSPVSSPTPAPVSSPAPSGKPVPFGPRQHWLDKDGNSGTVDKGLTRTKYHVAAYGAVKASEQMAYVADAGPSGFNAHEYEASGSAHAIAHDVRTAGGAVAHGVQSGARAVRGAVGLGGGPSSGNPGKASEVFTTVKGFAETSASTVNSGDWMGWVSRGLQTIIGAVSPFVIFAMFVKTVVGLIDKFKDYKSIKATFDTMQAKKAAGPLAPADEAMYDATKYAVPKVKRGALERFGFFVGDLAKLIMHIITIVSGGTAFMATETAALGITLLQSGKKFINGVKGAYKAIRGTRGKNRAKNAKVLVDNALEGHAEALTLLRELNPFSMGEKWKTRAKTVSNAVVSTLKATPGAVTAAMSNLVVPTGMPVVRGASGASSSSSSGADERISAYPRTNEELHTKLIAMISGKDGPAKRDELEKNVASKLKSS